MVVGEAARLAQDREFQNMDSRYYFGQMESAAVLVQRAMSDAARTEIVCLPVPAAPPRNTQATLCQAVQYAGLDLEPDAMRLLPGDCGWPD